MSAIEIVVLALVQGLTEFVPVSSSGHLLAMRLIFGISDVGGTELDAFLHIGTLLAVLVYFWPMWRDLISGVWNAGERSHEQRQLAVQLGIATLPGAMAGVVVQQVGVGMLRTPVALAGALVVTAALLWLFDVQRSAQVSTKQHVSNRDALIIGLWQMLALVPGISRSGVTIAAGRQRGLSRRRATTFSFLMSAPIIAGAGLGSIPALLGGSAHPLGYLLLGLVVAFISGLLAISGLMKLIERISFVPFSIYLLCLAAVVLYVG